MDKEKRRKNKIIIFLMYPLILLGILFLSSPWLAPYLSKQFSERNSIFTMSSQEKRENQTKEATYNYAEAQFITPLDIYEATFKSNILGDRPAIVGSIAIPSVNIQLPIIKGTSQQALSLGAGTMKANEKMGKNNYALASHNMNDDTVLFSPLRHIQIGDNIYTSDGKFVFFYKTTTKKYVDPSDIEVIQNHGRDEITLVTCSMSGKTRLIVQGIYEGKEKVKNVSVSVKKAFNLS